MENHCGNNASTVTATATTTTSSQVHDDGFAPLDDEILILPDGRNLAYRVCGYRACNDTSSSSSSSSDNDNATIRRHMIAFAFHGALGTGNFDLHNARFKALGWFVVSPTLPGWGLSSPFRSGGGSYTLEEYVKYDVQHLVNHIFDNVLPGITSSNNNNNNNSGSGGGICNERREITCLGISYGCIHAMACAMHLRMPVANVNSLCLLGPQGPFDDTANSNFDPLEGMALPSRIGLGNIGYYFPLLTKMTAKIVQNAVSTPVKAKSILSKLTC